MKGEYRSMGGWHVRGGKGRMEGGGLLSCKKLKDSRYVCYPNGEEAGLCCCIQCSKNDE